MALSRTGTTLHIRSSSTSQPLRCFSTTSSKPHKTLEKILAGVPPYPYPINRQYKKSWTGLYGGKSIRFGNNVPEQEFTITRRNWRPNVQSKYYWSDSLCENIHVRVVTSVMRTIEKVGGIDKYLLGGKSARLKELGPMGWKLRWRIINTPAVQRNFEKQRKELGLLGPMRPFDLKGEPGIKKPIAYRLPTRKEMLQDYGYTKGAKTTAIVKYEAEKPEEHVDEIRMSAMEEVESGEVQAKELDSGVVVEEDVKANMAEKIAAVKARHDQRIAEEEHPSPATEHVDEVQTSGLHLENLDAPEKLQEVELGGLSNMPAEDELQAQREQLEGSAAVAEKNTDMASSEVVMPSEIPSIDSVEIPSTTTITDTPEKTPRTIASTMTSAEIPANPLPTSSSKKEEK